MLTFKMIDSYLRQGYNLCHLQGKKMKENVIVVIIVPLKCFDHTGVHREVIDIEFSNSL